MTPRELIAFRRCPGFSSPEQRKRAQALAIGTREDIIMLDKAPNGKVSDLLNALDRALSAGEVERAVDLFQTDCYWRDLVTFTWNIKTMEGREQVGDMLKARLADTKPSNWRIADGEDASEADGITESWIQFETGVARGFGHLRVKDGRIWTLVTTMSELRGTKSRLAATVRWALNTAPNAIEKRGRKNARRKPKNSATRVSPIASSLVAVRAASRSEPGCASSMCRRSSSKKTRGLATAGASVTNHPACTIRFGMIICPICRFPGTVVTMVQRSTTHIVRSDSLMELGLAALYSEQAVQSGMTTAKADLIFASLPYKILHEFQIPVYNAIRERDADFYKRLEKAGFLLDYGDDDSGLFMKYLRRGSGYYIDVGASELIANGSIKLKSGVDIAKLTEHSVILSDGTELPADLVVYATGYGSMNGWAADLISREVADKVGKVWGLGSNTTKDPGPWEGEQRNMWKPTHQEGLWFHGGHLHQSRHYSQFLSLQLKARMDGIPTPAYGLQKVHHLG